MNKNAVPVEKLTAMWGPSRCHTYNQQAIKAGRSISWKQRESREYDNSNRKLAPKPSPSGREITTRDFKNEVLAYVAFNEMFQIQQ